MVPAKPFALWVNLYLCVSTADTNNIIRDRIRTKPSCFAICFIVFSFYTSFGSIELNSEFRDHNFFANVSFFILTSSPAREILFPVLFFLRALFSCRDNEVRAVSNFDETYLLQEKISTQLTHNFIDYVLRCKTLWADAFSCEKNQFQRSTFRSREWFVETVITSFIIIIRIFLYLLLRLIYGKKMYVKN